MFKRKSSPKAAAAPVKSSDRALDDLPNTPPAHVRARAAFAEVYGGAKVESNRWFLVSLFLLCGIIVCAVALMSLAPLKTVKLFVVEYERTSGVVGKPVEVETVSAPVAVVKADLARWIEAAYSIDPLRSTELLKFANTRTRGNAVAQFSDFRARERIFDRIAAEAGLFRQGKAVAIDVSQSGTAFVSVTTEERVEGKQEVKLRRFRVTINYTLDPPRTEAEIYNGNPLGIYITNFTDVEERA